MTEPDTWLVTCPNGRVIKQSGMTRAEVLQNFPGSKVEPLEEEK